MGKESKNKKSPSCLQRCQRAALAPVVLTTMALAPRSPFLRRHQDWVTGLWLSELRGLLSYSFSIDLPL